MTSAVITENRSVHSGIRFPYVFIRDDKEGGSARFTLEGSNTPIKAEGRHESHADKCWLSRFSLKGLRDGIYLAQSKCHGRKDITAKVVVKNGSVESLV